VQARDDDHRNRPDPEEIDAEQGLDADATPTAAPDQMERRIRWRYLTEVL
jgi:hypothetical protein